MKAMRFVILGRPVVKKNNKQIRRKGRGGKPFISSSTDYIAWQRSAVMQLKQQWHGLPALPRGLTFNAEILTYLGPRQRSDASNLYEGPQDALEQAGVIANDYQIVSHDGSRRLRDADNPRVEIVLTVVDSPKRRATA